MPCLVHNRHIHDLLTLCYLNIFPSEKSSAAYSGTHKAVEYEDGIFAKLCVFHVVIKQIV